MYKQIVDENLYIEQLKEDLRLILRINTDEGGYKVASDPNLLVAYLAVLEYNLPSRDYEEFVISLTPQIKEFHRVNSL